MNEGQEMAFITQIMSVKYTAIFQGCKKGNF